MQIAIWRLYRHLLFSGVIIVIGCYLAMVITNHKLDSERVEQFVNIDANLSSLLLLSDIDFPDDFSQFDFTHRPSATLSAEDLLQLVNNKQLTHLGSGGFELVLGDPSNPVVRGVIDSQKQTVAHIESLLRLFINSPKLTDNDKHKVLKELACLKVQATDLKTLEPFGSVSLMDKNELEFGYVWQGEGDRPNLLITLVPHTKGLPLNWWVVLVVAVALVIMLLVIWRELVNIDKRRRKFENITRQIARGKGTLPKSIPDGDGALKELAYSFDSMSTHIERLLKVQREMINAISHELRTPIARLRFGLEVMKDDVDEVVEKTIEGLEDDVEELNTLVDEVLTYGKLEEGALALNFENVSVHHLVSDILQNNQSLLKKLSVDVQVDTNSTAIADEHHLRRALQNLILNASKYANSKISVTFTEDTERWMLDIEDDGPGIPFEDRDKVFIPFQRLDNSRTRASGGYGLGLAIVQRIAFWHGGAVLIGDSDTGGAKFSLIWSRKQHQEKES
ncbi:ATP-binding protein [Marinomonas epiphytica]